MLAESDPRTVSNGQRWVNAHLFEGHVGNALLRECRFTHSGGLQSIRGLVGDRAKRDGELIQCLPQPAEDRDRGRLVETSLRLQTNKGLAVDVEEDLGGEGSDLTAERLERLL